ncbi:MAG: 30S ribosomal protein S12 methylthiotransferase RimO [Bacteroidota bacterium]
MAARTKVSMITLGCPKNVVDSETLMGQMRLNGIELAGNIDDADIAIINTCGFIDAARAESIDTIIETVHQKDVKKLKKVLVMGCLVERYRSELAKEIPEVDRFFGTHEIPALLEELGGRYRYGMIGERVLTTPAHYAYLKILEGCDNPCSFCSIPLMRGRLVSRPIEEILKEAELLASRGVKEIVVIGQDTTAYGIDRTGKRILAKLLEEIAAVDGIKWIRLMYTYPAKFPMEILEIFGRTPKLCRYIDIPIQHISDGVLQSMHRGITQKATRELLKAFRDMVPDIALRTTLIVGYPTETAEDFEELLNFVGEERFERLGVFSYSHEEGTPAHELGDPVPCEVKEERLSQIMELQRDISEARNQSMVGKKFPVLIDRIEQGWHIGRTESDAPEIDNEVYCRGVEARCGEFYQVSISDAVEYDLYGDIVCRLA